MTNTGSVLVHKLTMQSHQLGTVRAALQIQQQQQWQLQESQREIDAPRIDPPRAGSVSSSSSGGGGGPGGSATGSGTGTGAGSGVDAAGPGLGDSTSTADPDYILVPHLNASVSRARGIEPGEFASFSGASIGLLRKLQTWNFAFSTAPSEGWTRPLLPSSSAISAVVCTPYTFATAYLDKELYLFTPGLWDNTCQVLHISGGQAKAVQALRAHRAPVACVTATPDAAYLVTGSWDTTCVVWELQSERSGLRVFYGQRHTLYGHDGEVRALRRIRGLFDVGAVLGFGVTPALFAAFARSKVMVAPPQKKLQF